MQESLLDTDNIAALMLRRRFSVFNFSFLGSCINTTSPLGLSIDLVFQGFKITRSQRNNLLLLYFNSIFSFIGILYKLGLQHLLSLSTSLKKGIISNIFNIGLLNPELLNSFQWAKMTKTPAKIIAYTFY